MDDNDDVVGGPLQNILPGCGAGVPGRDQPVRRGARPVGRLGDQCGDPLGRRRRRMDRRPRYLRDQSLAGAAGDARSRGGGRSAVRSPAGVVHARRTAAPADACSRSARWRCGIRTAACWSACATPPRRTIRRTFAPAPLDDLLGTVRARLARQRRRRRDGALLGPARGRHLGRAPSIARSARRRSGSSRRIACTPWSAPGPG